MEKRQRSGDEVNEIIVDGGECYITSFKGEIVKRKK